MTIKEIKANIYREDKMICAVNCETSEPTINQMLSGVRNHQTELGKRIMAELERLAKINIQSKSKKQAA